MAEDYYDILGVPRTAGKQEIKKAYLKLAKKYNPDLNKEPDASEKFKKINEAASVLGDDSKREQYDRFGTAAPGGFGTGGGFDFRDFGNFSDFGFDFSDIFDRFFSGEMGNFGRRARQQRRGSDLHYNLEIELEDAAKGAKKNVLIPRLEKCSKCGGSGAESQSGIKKCENCNGSGMVQRVQSIAFGTFTTATMCGKCRGAGQYIKNQCSMCDGDGRVEKSRTIEVSIPAGIDTGNTLRISGQGEAGERGAPSGDLFITIKVKPHRIFEREGTELHIEVPVPFSVAALGGEVEVPTLEGTATLKIPAGTQSNTVFRMKGKGLPEIDGSGKGDENVKAVVAVPKKLSSRQKQLLKDFAKDEQKGLLGKLF